MYSSDFSYRIAGKFTLQLLSVLQELQMIAHLLSLPKTQKPDTEALEFKQDVVNSRMCVAGEQHTEATCVKDANLEENSGMWKEQVVITSAEMRWG